MKCTDKIRKLAIKQFYLRPVRATAKTILIRVQDQGEKRLNIYFDPGFKPNNSPIYVGFYTQSEKVPCHEDRLIKTIIYGVFGEMSFSATLI